MASGARLQIAASVVDGGGGVVVAGPVERASSVNASVHSGAVRLNIEGRDGGVCVVVEGFGIHTSCARIKVAWAHQGGRGIVVAGTFRLAALARFKFTTSVVHQGVFVKVARAFQGAAKAQAGQELT